MGLPEEPVQNAYNFVTVSIIKQSCNKHYNKMKTSMCVMRVQNVLCL